MTCVSEEIRSDPEPMCAACVIEKLHRAAEKLERKEAFKLTIQCNGKTYSFISPNDDLIKEGYKIQAEEGSFSIDGNCILLKIKYLQDSSIEEMEFYIACISHVSLEDC